MHQVVIDLLEPEMPTEECTTPGTGTPEPTTAPRARRTFIVQRPYAYIVKDVPRDVIILAGRVEFP